MTSSEFVAYAHNMEDPYDPYQKDGVGKMISKIFLSIIFGVFLLILISWYWNRNNPDEQLQHPKKMEEYYVCVNNIHHFKKLPDGRYLHVSCPLEDHTVFTNDTKVTESYTFKEGECLINTVDSMSFGKEEAPVESTKEQFDTAIRTAIFNLGLYKYIEQ